MIGWAVMAVALWSYDPVLTLVLILFQLTMVLIAAAGVMVGQHGKEADGTAPEDAGDGAP